MRLPVTCVPMVLFMTAFCALSVFQSLLLQELRLRVLRLEAELARRETKRGRSLFSYTRSPQS